MRNEFAERSRQVEMTRRHMTEWQVLEQQQRNQPTVRCKALRNMTGAKVGEVIMLPVSEAQALQQCGRVEILPN